MDIGAVQLLCSDQAVNADVYLPILIYNTIVTASFFLGN